MAESSTTESTGRAAGFRRAFAVPGGAAALLAQAAVAASTDVERLPAQAEAPQGAVLEILETERDAPQSLLPEVRDSIDRIRARFPTTEFTVVSHRREGFPHADKSGEYAEIHVQQQSLVADEVAVHICETHAGWYGVTAEDFPDYADLAPAGPGQIRLYRQLGWELIVVY